MKKIDNFEQIKSLLKFEDNLDDFYFLQIIKRRKENQDMNSNSSVVKTYYVTSVDYLEKKKDEIIMFCEKSNARACISLNKRSFKKIAFHTLKKVTEQICNNDFHSVRNAYDKACGAYSSETDKNWIIDLDGDCAKNIDRYIYIIEQCKPYGDKFFYKIETPNGLHLISKPFNVSEFQDMLKMEKLEAPDIHKNNPTILYYKKP